jgi:hypothetical protein
MPVSGKEGGAIVPKNRNLPADNGRAASSKSRTSGPGGTVIALVGPPRTGSSATLRGLACLGVYLGGPSDLREAGPANPDGYWEDKRTLAVCENFADAIGLRWDSLRLLSDADYQTPTSQHYTELAEEAIRYGLNNSPNRLWGVKNPRMARAVHLWMAAFASVGCDDRYLVTLRNPLSVAASIIRGSPYRRAGSGPTHLHLVWLLHVVGALTPAMAGRPTVVVDYDTLMAQPASELRRIANGLALTDLDETAIDAYGKEFLKGGLRHAAFSAADLAADRLVPPIVNRAYTLLLGAANDGLDLGSQEFQDEWKNIISDVGQIAPILRVVDEYDAARRRKFIGALYRRLPIPIKRLLTQARR